MARAFEKRARGDVGLKAFEAKTGVFAAAEFSQILNLALRIVVAAEVLRRAPEFAAFQSVEALG